MSEQTHKIRLDKWLWAARFFKTRALAKGAIEGGKVHYEGQRCKVSKTVDVGAKLTIRQGFDEKIVMIKALSEQRRGAPEARLLYEETPESIKARMDKAEYRKVVKASQAAPDHKPNKKERRDMRRFEHNQDY
ncbi:MULTISPECIES: ribosome-associated heat shock protein Hsp15 [Thalassolituus]|jgi:ribosome-associated heat shock protein Hsp15|uniref:Heat shock protein 15 n=1 Tax=Thalassolituus maritimus TaxID=484498 RepID=A0A1N7JN15_9GAMM|nr:MULTISPECIES: ribosome-associated heat shock protein Hsp15 [Thalassolituus]MAX85694.1 RNA-binding protein [Oceanospirillaceae bacterium]MEE3209910.1 ribosome-associated heat shock protein Hsp15 [Pseudomonadota bacterium]TPD55892.1 MAG: ribosome-associated heat shock protein Hsp15 [Thalassolituus maritimus]SIS50763.1 heat shock protein Hsp15 [Thalassolituus maritimus]|tara:strand:+ start:2877 stop:3275 length:399 start_codon:yes stop_codon:yes gene_type:complete